MNRDDVKDLMQVHHDAIGALLEAAIRDQVALSKSRDRLDEAIPKLELLSRSLPLAVKEHIGSCIGEEVRTAMAGVADQLEDAKQAALDAASAYREGARYALWKVAITAVIVTLIAVGGIYLAARILVPSAEDILKLREENASEQRLAQELEKRTRGLDIAPCPQTSTPQNPTWCARIRNQTGTDYYEILRRNVR